MKAKINQRLEEPFLTIGMIVKNEEKYLDGCLKALEPLRQGIKSELIIVDTGSTDSTVEIAHHYTDQVFHFDWVDSFSAARNAALERAHGNWYMSIDADEYMDDPTELIRFLNNPGNAEFVGYTIRSYDNPDEKGKYGDFSALRIFKIRPNHRYVGRVHEHVRVDAPVSILTGVVVHHYGYSLETMASKAKTNRNLPLLKMDVEELPDDPLVMYQLAREYLAQEQFSVARECYHKALNMIKNPLSNIEIYGIRYDLVKINFNCRDYVAALEEGNAFLSSGLYQETISALGIHFFMAHACYELEKYDEALVHCQEYERLLELENTHSLKPVDRAAVVVVEHQPQQHSTLQLLHVNILHKLENNVQSISELENFSLNDYEIYYASILPVWFSLVVETGQYERVWKRYLLLKDLKDNRAAEYFRNHLDAVLKSEADAREQVCKDIAAWSGDDPYAKLVLLRCTEAQGQRREDLLRELLAQAPTVQRYAELVYFAIKWDIDALPFISRVDNDDLSTYLTSLGQLHDDTVDVICMGYVDKPLSSDLQVMRWELTLMERVLLAIPVISSKYIRLFDRHCRTFARFTDMLYQGAIWEQGLSSVIPHAHRFGHMMSLALQAKQDGDLINYLKLVVEAGKVYPVFQRYIKELAQDVENALAAQRERDKERDLLYQQVKEKIWEMIMSSDLSGAQAACEAYAKINPKDAELAEIWTALGQPQIQQ